MIYNKKNSKKKIGIIMKLCFIYTDSSEMIYKIQNTKTK